MLVNVGRHLGTILTAIRDEHRLIREIVRRHGYDILVSDNRYGCYTTSAYSVFLCHQVNIQSPLTALDPALSAFHHRIIRRFDECWIPDFPDFPGLSGQLGHDHHLPHARYIGPVSRMTMYPRPLQYRLTAVLSGPEPQRSRLEKLLREQMPQWPFPTALVSGVVSSHSTHQSEGNLTHFPYLASEALNDLLLESEVILCRSGYSSLMDLAALGKVAICIPTPGQTEQEYLSRIHEQNGFFLRQEQDSLNLSDAMNRIPSYTGYPTRPDSTLLRDAIESLQ